MGRGVSVPSGAFAVAYRGLEYQEQQDDQQLEWEALVQYEKERVQKYWPSFQDCDKWLDREDHAVLENAFAYFGISEYCGCVSLWLVPKDQCDSNQTFALRQHWQEQVGQHFVNRMGTMVKLGTFSNGESVFKRKEAVK